MAAASFCAGAVPLELAGASGTARAILRQGMRRNSGNWMNNGWTFFYFRQVNFAMAQSTQNNDDALGVSVLEALPYIQRFSGRRIVIKYGGACIHPELRAAVFRDLALLACGGVQPVVVHGGGPEINQWLQRRFGQFRDGLRVTDADTMDVVEMVLVGRVNKQIVNGLNQLGAAVGLSR